MKKLIGSTLAIIALALTTNAAVLVNETFSLPDGTSLSTSQATNLPGGTWGTHSGTIGQLKVTSGKATLVTSDTEDINRTIGVAYSNQTLFVSFNMNLTVLPTATTYFAHLGKDGSTFKSRVWAITNGAAAGKFRLAVTSSVSTVGAQVPITTDLDPGTEYKVVMRFLGGTNATLWINPTSEASVVNRADGTDVNTLGTWISRIFCFRQSSGMGGMTIDDLKVGDLFSDVQTVGGPPSISGLVPVSIPANSNTGPMTFLISDVETATNLLTVAATSSNPTLVPNNPTNLTFSGPNTNTILTVTPALGQQGTASIEVVVTDGNSEKATNTFTVTVGSPSISAIANQITPNGTPIAVNVVVNDTETAPGSLTVTATSSDQAVLPDANIGVFNPGSTSRTINMTNAAAGFAVVTVTVSDGTFSIPTTFTLTAAPDNGILLAEDFGYADGSIITNSLASAPHNWTWHSGTTGQTQVASSKLLLVNTASEDINRWFTNNPVASTSGQLLFTRMVVNLSALPTAGGTAEYFTHVYGFSGAFRARVFATTNGAAAGKYRINITSAGFNTGSFPLDLSTNEPHVIISRYNTATAEAKLWVDPASEASTSLTAIDVSAPITAYGIAFRQQSGIGSMSIDDLLVGSTFNQVLLVLPSSNADLSALALSAGTLAPSFVSNTVSYAASVPNATASMTVTPTSAHAGATIEARVNAGSYSSVASASPSGSLALNVGANTVDVKVTAQDTTTIKTYTVTVTRAVAPPTPENIVFTTSGSNLILSWGQANWTGLLTGTNVTGVTNAVGATSPYTNSLSAPETYFRLYYTP